MTRQPHDASSSQGETIGLSYGAILVLSATGFLIAGIQTGAWLIAAIAAAGGGLSIGLGVQAIIVARNQASSKE